MADRPDAAPAEPGGSGTTPGIDFGATAGTASGTASGRVFYGWWIVAALAVSQTVGYGVLYYAFAVVLTPMREELHASSAQVTGALTLALLVSAVAAVPIGRWLDLHGGRALMTAGSIAGTALVAAWAAVDSLTQLYLVFAGIGLVSAMVLYEPAFAVIVTWFHQRRATALLAVTIVAGFASTIFMPLTGWLTQAHGWRTALLTLAVIHGVLTIPLHILIRRHPADLGLHPDGAPAPSGDTADTADTTDQTAEDRHRRELARIALRDPAFWAMVVAFVAQTAAVAVIGVHLVAYLLDLGHSAAFAATVTGLLGILSVTGRLATTATQRRLPVTTTVAAVFTLQALSALAFLLVGGNSLGAIGCVLGFGLGFGVATIARPALLADRYGTLAYGTISGLLTLPLTIAKATAPLAAALILNATSSYSPVMIATAAACATAAAGLLLTGRFHEPSSSQPARHGPSREHVRHGPLP